MSSQWCKISISVQWNSQFNPLTFSFVDGSERRWHRNEVHQEAETLFTVKEEKRKTSLSVCVCVCVVVVGESSGER